jgi:hypothetical protein
MAAEVAARQATKQQAVAVVVLVRLVAMAAEAPQARAVMDQRLQ